MYFTFRMAIASIQLFGICAGAMAACVNPVPSPATAKRSAWQELIDLKADKSLNPAINFVQQIDRNGAGNVNLDYYAVTFDAAGKSAPDVMTDFRANIQTYIYKNTFYAVAPADDASRALWAKTDPKGAVMVFTLASFYTPTLPLERGAVVVSCSDPGSFVFSTVNVGGLFGGAQDHPVAGNRGFGVVKNPDGSMTLFTKAADRRKSDNVVFAAMTSDRIFGYGAGVWETLLDNLKQAYAPRHPRTIVSYKRQETWP